MKKIKEKTITRQYGEVPNGNPVMPSTSVWAMDFIISIDKWEKEDKYFVHEQRKGFTHKKFLFAGLLKDAENLFNGVTDDWFIHRLEVNGF